MRNLFNHLAARKFEAELLPLNDPAFEILRASEVGRALLALNGDAEQRVYKSPQYMGTIGIYQNPGDFIVLSDSLFELDTPLRAASTLAHELTHRLQKRHENSLGWSFKPKNGYERTVCTLLSELHANSIADIVLYQAQETFSKRQEKPDWISSFEDYCIPLPKTIDMNDKREFAQYIFEQNFTFVEGITDYISYDFQKYHEKKDELNAFSIFTGGMALFLGICSLATGLTDGFNQAVAPLVGTLTLGAGTAFLGKFSQQLTYDGEIRPRETFEYSGVNTIPDANKNGRITFECDDNYIFERVQKLEKMVRIEREGFKPEPIV